MRKAAIRSAGIRHRTQGWRVVTWVVLLAFTLQSFVTQTHIHWTPQASAATTVAKLVQNPVSPIKSPFEKDTSACPFCQAIVHAGAFFASGAPLLVLPAAWTDYVIPLLIAPMAGAPDAHSWRSRAPPQH
ncbi:MAG TPA: hypothetical protein VGK90_02535 [Rhizomicrobium sp.]|jgi:hypothetical protein